MHPYTYDVINDNRRSIRVPEWLHLTIRLERRGVKRRIRQGNYRILYVVLLYIHRRTEAKYRPLIINAAQAVAGGVSKSQ